MTEFKPGDRVRFFTSGGALTSPYNGTTATVTEASHPSKNRVWVVWDVDSSRTEPLKGCLTLIDEADSEPVTDSGTLTVTIPRSDIGAVLNGYVPAALREQVLAQCHEIPTTPGAYRDREGDLWLLDYDDEWHCIYPSGAGRRQPDVYAPFTAVAE